MVDYGHNRSRQGRHVPCRLVLLLLFNFIIIIIIIIIIIDNPRN
jgi:hypothetical protein